MDYVYTTEAELLMSSTTKAVRRCATIGGTHHGASYWWNVLVRYFQREPAAVSVAIPCELNLEGVRPGVVVFRRDGTFALKLNHDEKGEV